LLRSRNTAWQKSIDDPLLREESIRGKRLG